MRAANGEQPPNPRPSGRDLVAGGSANGRTGDDATRFRSVLFDGAEPDPGLEENVEPECFADLNLDQLVGPIVARKLPYQLAPFFYSPLGDLDAIRYRQAIFVDLERPRVRELAGRFADQELSSRYAHQRRAMSRDDRGFGHHHLARAFLNTALRYCETIERLAADLQSAALASRGLQGLSRYLDAYIAGQQFRTLRDQATDLDRQLDQVRYTFLLKGSRITVGRYDEAQPDYSEQVRETFARFQQGAEQGAGEGPEHGRLPQIDDRNAYAGIGVLHLVSKLYPELFARLDRFCEQHAEYLDHTIAAFDRELQFYLGYLEHIQPLRDAGLSFSYPRVSTADKSEQALDTFDLVLASQRVRDGATLVCNDVSLDGAERILVVTGPNNGGKTTLARTIGQLHYLARLGCPVAGHDTRLFVCDQIFTRFERREDLTTLDGRLQDELNRLRDALQSATPSSLLVLNEMFNSTTAQDALFLSEQILEQVNELDALCVCVTFLDELASFNDRTVSMVSTVDPDDPAIRTYRLVRRPADGRAYARALAEKHGLTYAQLTARGQP